MSTPPPAGPPPGYPGGDPSSEAATRRLTPPGPQYPPTAAYPFGPAGHPYSAPPPPPVPPRRRRRTGLVVGIVAGVVVLIAAALVAVFLFLPRSVSKADLEKQVTDVARGLVQSANCPGDLTAKKDQSIDCTAHLKDGTDVPARVTVTAVDGSDVNTFTRVAAIPKTDLQKLVSDDVASKYKRIEMTCTGDLAGKPDASTTCDGTDNAGVGLHVRATFDRLNPDLTVVPKFTPYDTAAEVKATVEAFYANQGITATATCPDDLLGEVGKSTTCQLTASDGSTATAQVEVLRLERGGYYLIYQITTT